MTCRSFNGVRVGGSSGLVPWSFGGRACLLAVTTQSYLGGGLIGHGHACTERPSCRSSQLRFHQQCAESAFNVRGSLAIARFKPSREWPD